VMGFGCNVPAVVNTRACSDCTRCTTISAISFGSACSYQLPATLAVFAAVGMSWLVGPYLFVLAATTLVYVAVIAPPEVRHSATIVERRTFLQRPDPRAVAREACHVVEDELEEYEPWQALAAVIGKATGVKGDNRVHGWVVSVRSVESRDGMTARAQEIDWETLQRIQSRITGENETVARVVYDVTHKPPATIEYE
ncbi:MAG: hypothetical protein QXG03_12380, partial [Halalkalicoccus sp.]